MATTTSGSTNGSGTSESAGILLIDLGSKKRKDVKRLRKGRGKLMDRVTTVVDDLRATGEIGGDSEVVVVVVKEKRKKRGFWG